jgi:hypothetical protein
LFDIEQAFIFGAAFSPSGLGANLGITIGEEDGSNLQFDFKGILGFGVITRVHLGIEILKDLIASSEVRFEVLPFGAGLRLSLGTEYNILENLSLSAQIGLTNSFGFGGPSGGTGFLGGVSSSLKF